MIIVQSYNGPERPCRDHGVVGCGQCKALDPWEQGQADERRRKRREIIRTFAQASAAVIGVWFFLKVAYFGPPTVVPAYWLIGLCVSAGVVLWSYGRTLDQLVDHDRPLPRDNALQL